MEWKELCPWHISSLSVTTISRSCLQMQSLEMRQNNANMVDCQNNREHSEDLVGFKTISKGRKLYISRSKEYNWHYIPKFAQHVIRKKRKRKKSFPFCYGILCIINGRLYWKDGITKQQIEAVKSCLVNTDNQRDLLFLLYRIAFDRCLTTRLQQ